MSEEQRTTSIPGRKEQYPIIVEHGKDKLPPTTNPNDITLRVEDPAAANRAEEGYRRRVREERRQVQEIAMPSDEAVEAEVIEIGNVRFYPQPLVGFEAQFTRGGLDSHVVEVDGERLPIGAGLTALYDALRASAKKAGKK